MNDILTRLEAANGPDREIDCLIREYLDARYTPEMRAMYYGKPTGEHVTDEGWFTTPEYTGSLDAAMTLVPENHGWNVGSTVGAFQQKAIVGAQEAYAATPAIALCIAALKARGAQNNATPAMTPEDKG